MGAFHHRVPVIPPIDLLVLMFNCNNHPGSSRTTSLRASLLPRDAGCGQCEDEHEPVAEAGPTTSGVCRRRFPLVATVSLELGPSCGAISGTDVLDLIS